MDQFTRQYLESLLWSTSVTLPCCEDELDDGYMDVDDDHALSGINEYDSCDEHWCLDDFDEESVKKARDDCDRFRKLLVDNDLWDSALQYGDEKDIAHDFCLTRNGHGAGFWDGDYEDYVGQKDSVGDNITQLIRDNDFREVNIYIDENGKISI